VAVTQQSPAETGGRPRSPRGSFDWKGLLRGFAQPWDDSPDTRIVYEAVGHALIMAQRLELAFCVLLAVLPGAHGSSTADQVRKLLDELDKKTLGQLQRQLAKRQGGEQIARQLEPVLRLRNDLVHNFLRSDTRVALMRSPAGRVQMVAEARAAGHQFQELAGSIFAFDLVVIAVEGLRTYTRKKRGSAVARTLDALADQEPVHHAP
jgi:hypothetical protein